MYFTPEAQRRINALRSQHGDAHIRRIKSRLAFIRHVDADQAYGIDDINAAHNNIMAVNETAEDRDPAIA